MDRITQLIANPFSVEETDRLLLEDLVERYPYCKPYQILLAMLSFDDDKRDDALAKCAVVLGDTTSLSYLMGDTISLDNLDNQSEDRKPYILEGDGVTIPPLRELASDIYSNQTEKTSSPEESVSEPVSLMTETLAKIYVKQKLYNEAIAAYSKLILKYPQKSGYFGNQIEEVKKLITKDN